MNSNIRDNHMYSDHEVEQIARQVEPHDFDRIAPPPQVWNNVLAELEVAVASEGTTAQRVSDRWFSSPRLLSAAAAVVLLVGVTVAFVATREEVPVEQFASAAMSDIGLQIPTNESADAVLLCQGDTCFVDVTLTAVPSAGFDADLELWVINSDVTEMHSLGVVDASGRFELPDDVSFEDFPIVDISVEPRDGEPTHSGQSMLRGVFEQT